MFKRHYHNLSDYISQNKVLVIYGPRRVGKTTLIEHYLSQYKGNYRLISGEDMNVQRILSSNDFDKIFQFCEGLDLLAIDEAQDIHNIGRGLKIIVDHIKPIHVIATGSSSFDLANKMGEPLVGRQNLLTLYPLSQLELKNHYHDYELQQNLHNYLRFGSYPEVLTLPHQDDKREYLTTIANSYLYKDILALNTVRNADILQRLVKKLAFYLGSEVSAHQFSNDLGVDVKTIVKYLDLLEKNFIITKLQGYSRNLANEITKKHKYYFYDLGIRNAVINQFNDIEDRNDIGALWENFVVIERIKRNSYLRTFHQSYFWRTHNQHEVDYIEEKDANVHAYEIKWNRHTRHTKGLTQFSKAYPNATTGLINQDNYLDFVCKT